MQLTCFYFWVGQLVTFQEKVIKFCIQCKFDHYRQRVIVVFVCVSLSVYVLQHCTIIDSTLSCGLGLDSCIVFTDTELVLFFFPREIVVFTKLGFILLILFHFGCFALSL